MRKTLIILALVFAVFATTGTAAVNTCNQLEYQSNGEFFNGQLFKCTFTANQFTTDRVNIQYDAQDIERLTSQDLQDDTATVTISTEKTRNTAKYQFDLKDQEAGTVFPRDIYDHRFISESFWFFSLQETEDWVDANCADFDFDGSTEYYRQGDSTYRTVWCVQRNERYGSAADIVNPTIQIHTVFSIDINGEKKSRTVSNADVGDGVTTRVGDLLVIRWLGNFDTGDNAPNPSNEGVIGVHNNDFTNRWRITEEAAWQSYRSYLVSDVEDDLESFASGTLPKSEAEATSTNIAEQAVEPFQDATSPFANSNIDVSDSLLQGGSIQLSLDDVVAYPVYELFIDGSGDLAVEVPTGDLANPQAEDIRFGEGDNSFVSASVENVGDGEAGVVGRASCDSTDFTVVDTVQELTIAPGATETASFEISGSSTISEQEVSGTCTVAFEETSTGEEVSTQFTATLVSVRNCEPGDRIEGTENRQTVIKECRDDGTGYDVVEWCDSDEKAATDDGRLQCVAEDTPPGGGGGLFSGVSEAFNNLFSGVDTAFAIFDILAGFVAAVAAFGLSREGTAFVGISNDAAQISVAGVVAVLIGLFVFNLVGNVAVKLLILLGAGLYLYI